MNEWNHNDYVNFLERKSTGLIYFYTPLCGTCQLASKMLLVVEELVVIEMGKMNLNFYPQLAKELAIESVPCLLFIKDGMVVETLYAFHSVPFLLDKIKSYI
ncbi:thioredoxin-like negative regulator of GroEL [Bacillus sp. SORGH_AS 510]|uniref:thioredoxin family protein n=1 Tax=Bacillus sp. SORGH_AS_0510 TaxID=3041771 RepID=UPI0027805845|nr:thioredoxin family protein [Bacillus sp. SORGH_AS_0510]MDQ1144481.1 thioredoxin-like negative regulator of GroEL [Bacillus sp. SORGH_AS_0510]